MALRRILMVTKELGKFIHNDIKLFRDFIRIQINETSGYFSPKFSLRNLYICLAMKLNQFRVDSATGDWGGGIGGEQTNMKGVNVILSLPHLFHMNIKILNEYLKSHVRIKVI